MANISIDYPLSTKDKLRVGYRPIGATTPFTYLPNYLLTADLPYTLDLPADKYDVELTLIRRGLCGEEIKVPTIKKLTAIPSTATISWDFFADDPGGPETATLTRSITVTHDADYVIKTSLAKNVYWFIIKEPVTETVKTKWYNTTLNNGSIPDQSWLSPIIVGNFRYYKTRDLQGFDQTADTTFSKT